MPLQDHIHLDSSVSLSGDKAPPLQWRVQAQGRLVIPRVFMRIRESLSGSVRQNILTNENGIVRRMDYRYKLIIRADYGYTTKERVSQLAALHGAKGFLCDSVHADTGSDHTADVRMVSIEVGEFSAVDPGLQHYYVDVYLRERTS